MLVARSPRSGSGAVGAAITNSEGAIIAVGQNRLLDLPGAPRRGRRLPGPGAWWSGVDRSAGPAVEAQRLHDLERGGGEDLDVRGGQHAGVLCDDGRRRAVGDGVGVAFDPGPGVL